MQAPIIGALMELSTERVSGMSIGSIPLSKIWLYLDRFNLPDWWEPILLQSDASLIAQSHKEQDRDSGARLQSGAKHPQANHRQNSNH
jgi:hypothetical protein